MCIAVPGEIRGVFHTQAKVTMMGVETTVNIQMIENPKIGEFVLVHAGCAIERIDKESYDDLFDLFKQFLDEDEKKDEYGIREISNQ